LAIGSFGWNEVVRTARRFQNFMKEMYRVWIMFLF